MKTSIYKIETRNKNPFQDILVGYSFYLFKPLPITKQSDLITVLKVIMYMYMYCTLCHLHQNEQETT